MIDTGSILAMRWVFRFKPKIKKLKIPLKLVIFGTFNFSVTYSPVANKCYAWNKRYDGTILLKLINIYDVHTT